jgi:hypothetical protein
MFFLLRSLKYGSLPSRLSYILTTSLSLYSHYLFLPIVLLHLCFASSLAGRKRFILIIRDMIVMGLTMLPSLIHLRSLLQRKDDYTFLTSPSVSEALPHFLIVPLLLFIALTICHKEALPWLNRRAALSYLWIVIGPVFFLILDKFFGFHNFIPRYWVWQSGGIACALLIYELSLKAKYHPTVRFGAFTALALSLGLFNCGFLPTEDWQSAYALAQRWKVEGNSLVYLQPGLIESKSSHWLEDEERLRYLATPYRYYQGEDPDGVIPLIFGPAVAEQWLARHKLRLGTTASVVTIVRSEFSIKESTRFLALAGFSPEKSQCFSNICVTFFSAPAS